MSGGFKHLKWRPPTPPPGFCHKKLRQSSPDPATETLVSPLPFALLPPVSTGSMQSPPFSSFPDSACSETTVVPVTAPQQDASNDSDSVVLELTPSSQENFAFCHFRGFFSADRRNYFSVAYQKRIAKEKWCNDRAILAQDLWNLHIEAFEEKFLPPLYWRSPLLEPMVTKILSAAWLRGHVSKDELQLLNVSSKAAHEIAVHLPPVEVLRRCWPNHDDILLQADRKFDERRASKINLMGSMK